MKKKFITIVPYGYIFTEGRRYFLLTSIPNVAKQEWEKVFVCWNVAKMDDPTDFVQVVLNGKASTIPAYETFTLRVSPANCCIEMGYIKGPIYIWEGEYEQEVDPMQVDELLLWKEQVNND